MVQRHGRNPTPGQCRVSDTLVLYVSAAMICLILNILVLCGDRRPVLDEILLWMDEKGSKPEIIGIVSLSVKP